MYFLGRHQWKSGAQVKAQLVAEDRQGAGTGTIFLGGAVFADVAHEFQVLSHGALSLGCRDEVSGRRAPTIRDDQQDDAAQDHGQ